MKTTIDKAPKCLNTNDKAMWVLGWNEAVDALKEALAQPEPVMDYDKEELRGTVWDTNKQSLAQPEQEPVAVAIIEVFGNDWRLKYLSLPVGKHKLYTQQYTYTSPPAREWVGLTDDQIKAMDSGVNSISSFYAGALWANEKLKEKNT